MCVWVGVTCGVDPHVRLVWGSAVRWGWFELMVSFSDGGVLEPGGLKRYLGLQEG
jgi:hypothetical protein